ncbi:hypothetical protein QEN19_002134 [Hanseniaspora menglaensis]
MDIQLFLLIFANFIGILGTNSYIHPDEQFQSIEPLLRYLLNDDFNSNNGSLTWEYVFNKSVNKKPIRSLAVLALYYGPIINFCLFIYNKFSSISALNIIHIVKAFNFIVFTLVFIKFNNVFNRSCSINKSASIFFVFTSYTLLTYQVRFFSNSIETVLLMLSIKFMKQKRYFLFAITTAIGFHNRITFIGWLAFPGLVLLYKECWVNKNYKKIVFKIMAPFLLASGTICKIDSKLYSTNELIYTPLENIFYNKNLTNLSKHGIHSKLTHVCVNIPALLGPFLIIFWKCKKKINYSNIPLMAVISGLVFHSLIPHQEARFLIPMVPLIIVSCDFKKLQINRKIIKLVVFANLLFNTVMVVLMGSLHQSGLISFLKTKENLSIIQDTDIGYWHTLMPSHWPYYISLNETVRDDLFINFVSSEYDTVSGYREFDTSLREVDFSKQKHNIIDFMGIDTDNLVHLLNTIKTATGNNQMHLVLPYSFLHLLSQDTNSFEVIAYDPYHLNLNDGLSTWPFGLCIAKIEY